MKKYLLIVLSLLAGCSTFPSEKKGYFITPEYNSSVSEEVLEGVKWAVSSKNGITVKALPRINTKFYTVSVVIVNQTDGTIKLRDSGISYYGFSGSGQMIELKKLPVDNYIGAYLGSKADDYRFSEIKDVIKESYLYENDINKGRVYGGLAPYGYSEYFSRLRFEIVIAGEIFVFYFTQVTEGFTEKKAISGR